MRRFFSEQPIAGSEVLLEGPEAHHLLHVDRVQTGQSVVVFDGSSGEYVARLVEASRSSARLEIVEHLLVDRMSAVEITLMTAVPKGRHMDVLVQMTCELGVRTLVPLITERSVVHPGPGRLDHWRRTVLESCKQSGRNRLMTIEPSVRLSEALERPRPDSLGLLLSTVPGAEPVTESLRTRPNRIVLLVGPEGGFTDDEEAAALRAGFRAVSLGSATLRIETAAVAVSALVVNSPG